MSDIAIEVDSVWKKFHRGEFHDSLRDFLPALARRALGRGPKRDELAEGDFWALKDVSFQVRQGEVLGIIGANGAGKSTLLKILAKILKPNRGQIRVNGRLRALIEVAAGFHPDLTGRENVYLNGSILGMKKREIDAKFDDIVEFSGISEFLDTPVKRYSSGMHARLGFAVAAHLEPEILIVDEVLAVGDAQFQEKCLGKMSDVAHSGRTILLVSHQMQAIQNIATRAILLNGGAVTMDGSPHSVVASYFGQGHGTVGLTDTETNIAPCVARFVSVRVSTNGQVAPAVIVQGEIVRLELILDVFSSIKDGNIAIAVRNSQDIEIFSHCWCDQHRAIAFAPGRHEFVVDIPTSILRPGPYWSTVCLATNLVDPVTQVSDIPLPSVTIRKDSNTLLESRRWGVVQIECQWSRQASHS